MEGSGIQERQLERQSKDREGWRDFLKDLSLQWGERVLASKSLYFFTLELNLPILKNTAILVSIDCQPQLKIKRRKQLDLRVLFVHIASLGGYSTVHAVFLPNIELRLL